MAGSVTSGRAGRSLEPEIQRYAKPVRRRLRKLAKSSSRLGDLIVAFPAAAFAIAIGRGPVEARAEAVRLVKDGAPLPSVAAALGLPAWLRKLPPEAFEDEFGAVIDTPDAAKRLGDLAPEPQHAARWFAALGVAFEAGGAEADPAGEAAAIWAARQEKLFQTETPLGDAVAMLGAYVWHSRHPQLPISGRIARGFSAPMSLHAAATETADWLHRVIDQASGADVGDRKRRARWFEAQRVGQYGIVPLRTPEALEQEGRAMNHCVGVYAGHVLRGVSLIYGVRRGAQRVATLEIRASRDRPGGAYVSQLYGARNTPATPEVRAAVDTWLAAQGPCPLRGPTGAPNLIGVAPVDRKRWDAGWAPYRAAARGRAALLVATPPGPEAADPMIQAVLALRRLAA